MHGYFIPTYNRFYSVCIHIKPWRRYSYFFIVGSTLLTGWYFGVYARIEQVLELKRQEIARMHNELLTYMQEKKLCLQCQATINDIRREIYTCTNDTQCKDVMRDQRMALFKQAQRAGLTITAYTIENEIDKEWYVKQGARFEGNGTLESALNFLHAIKSSKKLVQCKHIHVERMNDTLFNVSLLCRLVVLK